MASTPAAPVAYFVCNLPARCDCGEVWTLTFDSYRGLHHLACPRCGAGLEVRSYGPPLPDGSREATAVERQWSGLRREGQPQP